jgi:hypothetical protein
MSAMNEVRKIFSLKILHTKPPNSINHPYGNHVRTGTVEIEFLGEPSIILSL